MTVPKDEAMVWTWLAIYGDFSYLMDKLSKDTSWIVMKNYAAIRPRARREAESIWVKCELTNTTREHMIWLIIIQVLRFP